MAETAYSLKQIADFILKAQQIHEESYVKGPDSHFMMGGVEMSVPSGEYGKNHLQAAYEACGEVFDAESCSKPAGIAYLIYLASVSAWNDVQMWAETHAGKASATPAEKDVPHWAVSMVDNHRRESSLPPRVTDRMIFARLQECSGMDQEDVVEAVRDLIKDTE